MTLRNKFFVPILITLIFSSGQAFAENSWWKKGTDLLNTLEKESPAGTISPASAISIGEMGDAFKEALKIGSENVVNKLGTVDGFNTDTQIHIPLPNELNTVKTVLGKVGMSGMVDDLELKLNRAAEAATPKAKALFLQSISEMTFDDVKTIYEGPEDSATQYFKQKMSSSLSAEMRPIIENSLSTVGAVQAYDNMIGQYKNLPFVPNVKADLTDHVVQKGMDGIFYYIAQEEAAIRSNPIKQSTALLKKVFGKQ